MLTIIKRTPFKMIAFTAAIVTLFYMLMYRGTNKPHVRMLAAIGPRVLWASKITPVLHAGKLGNFEPETNVIRSGPGENGTAYHLQTDSKFDVIGRPRFGMNIAVSDAISLHRTIPDTRMPECRYWSYPEKLPSTSVVIVFHNEGNSVLLRTVHSVIDRSPPQFLEEVLLVDDFSSFEHLKNELEMYILETFPKGNVRLIRNDKREGLIRSKSRGAIEARGDVVIFLDAHCEVNTNWLVPLLAPIARDPTVMTVPVIDGIDHENFLYQSVYQKGTHHRGIFEWGMLYKEIELPSKIQQTRKHESEPYKSPTHAGGLFAINRKYFLKLNTYDPGLLVWGGENFELSFKIWQCGGSIEWVPCSRVGHVYRGYMPYDFGELGKNRKGPLITINYKRVIETWFDEEYKNYFYTREPLARFLEMGDISDQLKLKHDLKCKNFQWFMDNVAYDVFNNFPKLPPNLYWGELKTNSSQKMCLDCLGGSSLPAYVQLRECHHQGQNQLFRLNAKGQLGVGERCIEVETRHSDSGDQLRVIMAHCRLGTVDGPWQYDKRQYLLYHRGYRRCMTVHPQTLHLYVAPCDPSNVFQAWYFRQINPYS